MKSICMYLMVAVILFVSGGCTSASKEQVSSRHVGYVDGFVAKSIVIKQAFTRIIRTDDDLKVVDAYIELLDQFGDPIKVPGKFTFLCYEYDTDAGMNRGTKFSGLSMELEDLAENQAHWDSVLQYYHFNIDIPVLEKSINKMILHIVFNDSIEGRLQDSITLEIPR